MADEKLTIVVGAKDNTGPALGGIKKSISGIGDVAKTAIGMALGGVLLKIPGMARDAGRAISDMVMDAAKVNDARLAFQGLGGDIEALRKGTLGMVADSELMLTYNEAAMLVGKTFADELPSAMGYLGKVAAATGQDMGFMMDSLTKGVGRLSPMILDNLGIQVSLADANQEYAATLGKTVGELTKGEQQTALMNQVMEKLAKNTADMPDIQDSLTTSMARVKASFANVKDTIGQALLPVMADLGKQFADFIQDHGPQIKEAIQKFSEFITDKLIPAIKTLYEWIRDKLMPVLQGIWGFIKDNMEPILAGLAVVLLAVVVPAFIAWAAAAISAAAATILAIAPVAIPILAIAAVIALLVAAWKKGWFNDIALFLEGVWNNDLKPIFDAIIEFFTIKIPKAVQDVRNAIINKWNEITRKVELFILMMRYIIANTFNLIKLKVQAAMDAIKNAIVNAWEIAKQWVKDKIQAIIDKVVGLWDKMKEAGKNIVEGIKTGIKNAWNSFISWIKGLLAGFRDTVLGFFGIHSPSEMMQGVGQSLMLGLAKGIADMSGIPEAAMKAVLDLVLFAAGGKERPRGQRRSGPERPSGGTRTGGVGGILKENWRNGELYIGQFKANTAAAMDAIWKAGGYYNFAGKFESIGTRGQQYYDLNRPMNNPTPEGVIIYGGLTLNGVQDARSLLEQLQALQ